MTLLKSQFLNSFAIAEDDKSSEISDTTYTYGSQDYKVDYSITSHWDGHCNIVIDITNTSDITIHNWNLVFCTDDKISNIYDYYDWDPDITEGLYSLNYYGVSKFFSVTGKMKKSIITAD